MVKCESFMLCVCLFVMVNVVRFAASDESCSKCVPKESCRAYGNLNREEQIKWQERFQCEEPLDKSSPIIPGFSSAAKGDLVCCPENVWGVADPPPQESNQKSDQNPDQNPDQNLDQNPGQNPDQNPDQNPNLNQRSNFNYRPNYEVNEDNQEFNPDDSNGYDDYDYDAQRDYRGNRRPNWQNRRRQQNSGRNPYFMPANTNVDSGSRGSGSRGSGSRGSGNRNNARRTFGGQCPTTSFPPNVDSGCCGLEASTNNGVNDSPNYRNNQYGSENRNTWMPQRNQPSQGWPSWMSQGYGRRKRDDNVTVSVGNRIAGGKETELEQYPWTVLLKTTFAYPTRDAAFSCGGSLISSRYVLTAGHCLFDPKGDVKIIEINLAEFDKRTFPKDCKFSLGRGEVCVENVVMAADGFTIHPEYDDNRLQNDIALIRLRGNAPYTDFIRPICLPPIDVDSPTLSNLRLAVAGWGRNGESKSNIKQSTVVNLVPQRECRNSYPNLSRKQVCAAGHTGEDTCKGDSGGPLMMMYNGKYYVSGVVSGKRADAPCGTSVPSLYTNVYQYVSWIHSVIKN